MKFRLLSESGGVKRYSIVLSKGDEVMSGLTEFYRDRAFSRATVAWFDDGRVQGDPINEQVELASMNRLPNCSSGLPEP